MKTYDELTAEILELQKKRQEVQDQVSAADKLKNRLNGSLRSIDLRIGMLYQERNGQKTLF